MRKRENLEGLLFVAPSLIGLLTFIIGPIVMSLIMSFTDWKFVSGFSGFVGIEHYKKLLLEDRYFWLVLKNTIYYTAVGVPISIFMGLMLALLLNRNIVGETIFRVIYYVPTVTSAVAIGLVWRWLYNPEFGLINSILRIIGINGPGWLSDLKWAMPSLIIVHIWQAMGYNMIIYLAGLQNISAELYEAAQIDGATKLQLFRYITFPMLTPTTFFLLVTSIIGSFQVYTLVAVMTSGGPAYRTAVYVYHLWSVAFQQLKMSYAAAMAWILFLIIFILTIIQLKLSSRWVFYGQ